MQSKGKFPHSVVYPILSKNNRFFMYFEWNQLFVNGCCTLLDRQVFAWPKWLGKKKRRKKERKKGRWKKAKKKKEASDICTVLCCCYAPSPPPSSITGFCPTNKLVSIPPCVNAVARKRPQPFCQKCGWQVTTNMHTPLTQQSQSGLTVLSRHLCGNLAGKRAHMQLVREY